MSKAEFLEQLGQMIDANEPLKGDEQLASLPGWDSMATISFIALADESLGLALAAEDVYLAVSVEDLVKLVSKNLDN